jgi:hypothetical protein
MPHFLRSLRVLTAEPRVHSPGSVEPLLPVQLPDTFLMSSASSRSSSS